MTLAKFKRDLLWVAASIALRSALVFWAGQFTIVAIALVARSQLSHNFWIAQAFLAVVGLGVGILHSRWKLKDIFRDVKNHERRTLRNSGD